MTEVKRPYDASGRRARADARRREVARAARELFERDGFRATTIAGVAAHAGVSAEMIYKVFGTKAALAKAVFDLVIAGDDDLCRSLNARRCRQCVKNRTCGARLRCSSTGWRSGRQTATGQLRDGIELAEVRDVLSNYLAIDTYERLVLARGWGPRSLHTVAHPRSHQRHLRIAPSIPLGSGCFQPGGAASCRSQPLRRPTGGR
jgi:AcrR family transcriptional regulator